MKQTYLILFALFFLMTKARSQEINSQTVNKISKQLDINKENATKVLQALFTNNEKIRQTMRDSSIGGSAKQKIINELLAARKARLDSVLTTDKQVLLSEFLKEKDDDNLKKRLAARKPNNELMPSAGKGWKRREIKKDSVTNLNF